MRGKGVRIGDGVPRSDGENLKIENKRKRRERSVRKEVEVAAGSSTTDPVAKGKFSSFILGPV